MSNTTERPSTEPYSLEDWFKLGQKILEKYTQKEEPKPEWEILKMISDGGYKIDAIGLTREQIDIHLKYMFKIHSVQRISDGEVFTVGDKTFMVNENYYKVQIKGFEIVDGKMRAYYGNDLWVNLSGISKTIPAKQEQEPIKVFEEREVLSIQDVKECFKSPHGSPLFNDLIYHLYNRVKNKTNAHK